MATSTHNSRPQTPRQASNHKVSAIGSEIFHDFERDIEDAIFETIERDQKEHRADLKKSIQGKSQPFGKMNSSGRALHTADNGDDSIAGLNVFSQKKATQASRPIVSQALLAMAICAFTMAIVLPTIWLLEGDQTNTQGVVGDIQQFAPDSTLATGSTTSTDVIPQILGDTMSESMILNKPNAILHVNETALHKAQKDLTTDGSNVGSVVYFGSDN